MITAEIPSKFLGKAGELKSADQFAEYLTTIKDAEKLTWSDIAYMVNFCFKLSYSDSYYRKRYSLKKVSGTLDEADLHETLLELQKERIKLSDERSQNRNYVRRLAREDTIKEIAQQAAFEMNKSLLLEKYSNKDYSGINEAILCISDWHYGIECDNHWNFYNTTVTRTRVSKLRDEVIARCRYNNVHTLHVMNLADLIAGRIHLTIRLESRIDVITQIMQVSEILAELLNDLSSEMKIHYYSCIDNHSRVEPNKSESLDLESLCRITDWYLKERLGSTVVVHDNTFGPDIIDFKCKGFSILGVHGDKDRPDQIIDAISRMTHAHYDLICTAHLHHFSADEKNETLIVSNGALMGTDNYARNLRLSARPSQNLIIVSDTNVAEAVYRIVL